MNNAIISLAVTFIISVFLLSCHENNNSTEGQVRTENEFFNDPGLTANPEKDLVVIFLEPPDALPEENQTGELGNDVFPLKYKNAVNHTFCWEDEDGEARHFMELDDSEGNEIFRLDVNGECVTMILEAGDYLMHIHHDGMIERTLPIFVLPVQEDLEIADSSSNGFIRKGEVLISNSFQYLFNVVTQNVNAQSNVDKNVRTLIRTNACPGCDLSGADLFGADLSGADLTGAVLVEANLAGTDLTEATLNQANIAGADLTGSVLISSNLSGASMVQTIMGGADMTEAALYQVNMAGADLSGANLSSANLTQANLATAILTGVILTDAKLPGVNLFGADLSQATWCDGTFCQPGSTGTCDGSRFIFNCDRTVTDTDTNLVWEKKDSFDGIDSGCPGGATCDNPHDVDNTYSWSSGADGDLTNPDGSAFIDFLYKLNNSCNIDPSIDCTAGGDADCMNVGDAPDCCGFACQRDWRLPEIGIDLGEPELETILDLQFDVIGLCIGPNNACIDPIFGVTALGIYWTATNIGFVEGDGAYTLDFASGIDEDDIKSSKHHVRAVRQ